MPDPLLRTESLTKEYGGFRALDRLDLEIAPGEIFGLLGPNGSGKSTAIRMLLGFLRPTSGSAWIDGHHCWTASVEVRRRVAYLPGELRLYENLTGRELVDFLCRLRGVRAEAVVDDLARSFDIDVARPIAELSSGMKRKVALLAVLAPRTPLVILDEPTNTLDPSMRDELLDQLLQARAAGQTILFSSHVLSEVEHVCDRVGILKNGRLVHLQRMADLRRGRRIQVSWTHAVPDVPDLPGVSDIDRRGARELHFAYDGPLPEILGWLSAEPVEDLRIEPVGLGGIYRRFHGNGG